MRYNRRNRLHLFASAPLLADTIALAAETRNLKLVSAETDALEADGLIQVEWLR